MLLGTNQSTFVVTIRRFALLAFLFAILSSGLFTMAAVSTQSLLIDDFSNTALSAWQKKVFKGSTRYEVVTIDDKSALKAVTNSSASALYQKRDINLAETPYLNWSWRVDNIYSIDDQKKKSGDDYPARLYVVVKEGILPWQSKALNYVWSNTPVTQQYWSNPFTSSAVMIPVRAGKDGLGRWHQERVNVREDFFRVFNRHIDTAHGVAIMSDSDNAKGKSVAYYGEIRFTN